MTMLLTCPPQRQQSPSASQTYYYRSQIHLYKMGSQCEKCFDVDLQEEPLNEMFLETTERIIKSDDNFVKEQPALQPKVDPLPSEESLPDLPRIDQLQSKIIKNSHINTTFNRRLTDNEGLYATVSDKKWPSIIEQDEEKPEQPIFNTEQRAVARGSLDGQNYPPELLFRGKAARNSQQK